MSRTDSTESMPPRVFRSLAEVPHDFGPCATTIGNFDGVHAGHQALMRRVAAISQLAGWKAAVLTFEPHPAKVVAPDRAPKMIMTLDQRAEVMGALGIEEILILPFTPEVSRWTPEEFVKAVLVDAMQARTVLVGEDFRFGHKQAGNTNTLRELGAKYGFAVDLIIPVNVRGERVSSSLVRRMVLEGRVNRAGRLLARPFALEGMVVQGHGIGARKTVPTLNLQPTTEVWPRNGVYVTRTEDLDSDRTWNSISNVGVRPTFGGHAGDAASIETFLLEPLNGPSPVNIRVEFLWRIRDERKFPSPGDLKNQILRDIAVTQKYFRRVLSRTGGEGRITTLSTDTSQQQPAAPVEPLDQVSIVIVSCNRIDQLRAALSALHATAANPALQIIVVDNGSRDGSASLDSDFPAAQFIRLPQNFGLTKALNIGIRAVDGNYVLFLHEDVEIAPEAVDLLRAELAQHPDTGAACPLLLDASGQPAPQVRDLPSPANPDPPFRPGKPGEVPAVKGAAIMVRRFLLNALRHIDERYGNYGSDVELSMQVRRANKKIVIVDGATAIHRPEPEERSAAFAADRQLGTAAFIGKYHGLPARVKYMAGAILGSFFTFKLARFRYLVSGQKIDGA